jgi:hypothetical protein
MKDEVKTFEHGKRSSHLSAFRPPPCSFSHDREAALASLEQERFDLLIVGGGITGAGIAHRASRSSLRARRTE